MKKIVDTKTLIINVSKKLNTNDLDVSYFLNFITFLYNELLSQDKLDYYKISFDVNTYSLERTVLYHNDLFLMSIDNEILKIKNKNIDELAKKYQVDETIHSIINKYVLQN